MSAVRWDRPPSELVALGRTLEEEERVRGRARQSAAGRTHGRGIASSRTPSLREEAIRRADINAVVGPAVGMSGATYARAKAVVRAAEADPARFGPVLAEMDRTGSVLPAYEAVRSPAPAPPPTGLDRSRTGVAARRARIVEMARAGYREESIAAEVGITEEAVRVWLVREGVPSMARKIGKATRFDADRAMEGLVEAAEPPAVVVKSIDFAALDRARLAEWTDRLTAAIATLTRIRNTLKGMTP